MKTASSLTIGILLFGILIASSVGAFERGENRLTNGGFETGSPGEAPDEWEIEKGG